MMGIALLTLLVIGLIATVFDTMRRRKFNRRLRETNEQLENSERVVESAVHIAGLVYWEYDIANARAMYSKQFLRERGLPEVIEHYPQSIVSEGLIMPQSVDDFLDVHARVRNGEPTASARVLVTNPLGGAPIWKRVSYTVYFDEAGNSVRAIGTSVPITEQIRMEKRYDAELQRLRTLDEQAVLVFRYDITDDTFSDWSMPGCEAMAKPRNLWRSCTSVCCLWCTQTISLRSRAPFRATPYWPTGQTTSARSMWNAG